MMRRKKFFFSVLAGLLLVLWLWYSAVSYKPYFHVVFFNVGEADSSLIFFDDGAKMLVDCGRNRAVMSKLGQYLPWFDNRIDYLLISHFDSDHYGGCAEVFKKYDVAKVISNGDTKPDDEFWQIWKDYLDREGAEEIIPYAGDVLNFGSAQIDFLVPSATATLAVKQTDNNHSVVFKLISPSSTFLFMGDAENSLETALLDTFCGTSTVGGVSCPELKADYLKVGHHGSDSSSGEDFLSAVNPLNAIISVGNNSYGHPSLRVLKKLERANIDIWRTDQMSDIIVK